MKIRLSPPSIPQWMFLVNLIGLALSTFMWRNAIALKVFGCLTGGGCETVLYSQYSKMFGVPIAAWGFAFYGVCALLTFIRLVDDRLIVRLLTWVAAVVSIFFSAYFVYLEAAVIHAFCSWCTVSTFLTIALLGLSLAEMQKLGGINNVIVEVRKLFEQAKA